MTIFFITEDELKNGLSISHRKFTRKNDSYYVICLDIVMNKHSLMWVFIDKKTRKIVIIFLTNLYVILLRFYLTKNT